MKLSDEKIVSLMEHLPGWSLNNGKLHKEYKFSDFQHAFGFMAASATAIESLNHHPEWFNAYNKVVVELFTHDEGGVTEKDLRLAQTLDHFARKLI